MAFIFNTFHRVTYSLFRALLVFTFLYSMPVHGNESDVDHFKKEVADWKSVGPGRHFVVPEINDQYDLKIAQSLFENTKDLSRLNVRYVNELLESKDNINLIHAILTIKLNVAKEKDSPEFKEHINDLIVLQTKLYLLDLQANELNKDAKAKDQEVFVSDELKENIKGLLRKIAIHNTQSEIPHVLNYIPITSELYEFENNKFQKELFKTFLGKLGNREKNILTNLRIKSLDELSQWSMENFSKQDGVGKKSLISIQNAMLGMNYSFLADGDVHVQQLFLRTKENSFSIQKVNGLRQMIMDFKEMSIEERAKKFPSLPRFKLETALDTESTIVAFHSDLYSRSYNWDEIYGEAMHPADFFYLVKNNLIPSAFTEELKRHGFENATNYVLGRPTYDAMNDLLQIKKFVVSWNVATPEERYDQYGIPNPKFRSSIFEMEILSPETLEKVLTSTFIHRPQLPSIKKVVSYVRYRQFPDEIMKLTELNEKKGVFIFGDELKLEALEKLTDEKSKIHDPLFYADSNEPDENKKTAKAGFDLQSVQSWFAELGLKYLVPETNENTDYVSLSTRALDYLQLLAHDDMDQLDKLLKMKKILADNPDKYTRRHLDEANNFIEEHKLLNAYVLACEKYVQGLQAVFRNKGFETELAVHDHELVLKAKPTRNADVHLLVEKQTAGTLKYFQKYFEININPHVKSEVTAVTTSTSSYIDQKFESFYDDLFGKSEEQIDKRYQAKLDQIKKWNMLLNLGRLEFWEPTIDPLNLAEIYRTPSEYYIRSLRSLELSSFFFDEIGTLPALEFVENPKFLALGSTNQERWNRVFVESLKSKNIQKPNVTLAKEIQGQEQDQSKKISILGRVGEAISDTYGSITSYIKGYTGSWLAYWIVKNNHSPKARFWDHMDGAEPNTFFSKIKVALYNAWSVQLDTDPLVARHLNPTTETAQAKQGSSEETQQESSAYFADSLEDLKTAAHIWTKPITGVESLEIMIIAHNRDNPQNRILSPDDYKNNWFKLHAMDPESISEYLSKVDWHKIENYSAKTPGSFILTMVTQDNERNLPRSDEFKSNDTNSSKSGFKKLSEFWSTPAAWAYRITEYNKTAKDGESINTPLKIDIYSAKAKITKSSSYFLKVCRDNNIDPKQFMANLDSYLDQTITNQMIAYDEINSKKGKSGSQFGSEATIISGFIAMAEEIRELNELGIEGISERFKLNLTQKNMLRKMQANLPPSLPLIHNAASAIEVYNLLDYTKLQGLKPYHIDHFAKNHKVPPDLIQLAESYKGKTLVVKLWMLALDDKESVNSKKLYALSQKKSNSEGDFILFSMFSRNRVKPLNQYRKDEVISDYERIVELLSNYNQEHLESMIHDKTSLDENLKNVELVTKYTMDPLYVESQIKRYDPTMLEFFSLIQKRNPKVWSLLELPDIKKKIRDHNFEYAKKIYGNARKIIFSDFSYDENYKDIQGPNRIVLKSLCEDSGSNLEEFMSEIRTYLDSGDFHQAFSESLKDCKNAKDIDDKLRSKKIAQEYLNYILYEHKQFYADPAQFESIDSYEKYQEARKKYLLPDLEPYAEVLPIKSMFAEAKKFVNKESSFIFTMLVGGGENKKNNEINSYFDGENLLYMSAANAGKEENVKQATSLQEVREIIQQINDAGSSKIIFSENTYQFHYQSDPRLVGVAELSKLLKNKGITEEQFFEDIRSNMKPRTLHRSWDHLCNMHINGELHSGAAFAAVDFLIQEHLKYFNDKKNYSKRQDFFLPLIISKLDPISENIVYSDLEVAKNEAPSISDALLLKEYIKYIRTYNNKFGYPILNPEYFRTAELNHNLGSLENLQTTCTENGISIGTFFLYLRVFSNKEIFEQNISLVTALKEMNPAVYHLFLNEFPTRKAFLKKEEKEKVKGTLQVEISNTMKFSQETELLGSQLALNIKKWRREVVAWRKDHPGYYFPLPSIGNWVEFEIQKQLFETYKQDPSQSYLSKILTSEKNLAQAVELIESALDVDTITPEFSSSSLEDIQIKVKIYEMKLQLQSAWGSRSKATLAGALDLYEQILKFNKKFPDKPYRVLLPTFDFSRYKLNAEKKKFDAYRSMTVENALMIPKSNKKGGDIIAMIFMNGFEPINNSNEDQESKNGEKWFSEFNEKINDPVQQRLLPAGKKELRIFEFTQTASINPRVKRTFYKKNSKKSERQSNSNVGPLTLPGNLPIPIDHTKEVPLAAPKIVSPEPGTTEYLLNDLIQMFEQSGIKGENRFRSKLKTLNDPEHIQNLLNSEVNQQKVQRLLELITLDALVREKYNLLEIFVNNGNLIKEQVVSKENVRDMYLFATMMGNDQVLALYLSNNTLKKLAPIINRHLMYKGSDMDTSFRMYGFLSKFLYQFIKDKKFDAQKETLVANFDARWKLGKQKACYSNLTSPRRDQLLNIRDFKYFEGRETGAGPLMLTSNPKFNEWLDKFADWFAEMKSRLTTSDISMLKYIALQSSISDFSFRVEEWNKTHATKFPIVEPKDWIDFKIQGNLFSTLQRDENNSHLLEILSSKNRLQLAIQEIREKASSQSFKNYSSLGEKVIEGEVTSYVSSPERNEDIAKSYVQEVFVDPVKKPFFEKLLKQLGIKHKEDFSEMEDPRVRRFYVMAQYAHTHGKNGSVEKNRHISELRQTVMSDFLNEIKNVNDFKSTFKANSDAYVFGEETLASYIHRLNIANEDINYDKLEDFVNKGANIFEPYFEGEKSSYDISILTKILDIYDKHYKKTKSQVEKSRIADIITTSLEARKLYSQYDCLSDLKKISDLGVGIHLESYGNGKHYFANKKLARIFHHFIIQKPHILRHKRIIIDFIYLANQMTKTQFQSILDIVFEMQDRQKQLEILNYHSNDTNHKDNTKNRTLLNQAMYVGLDLKYIKKMIEAGADYSIQIHHFLTFNRQTHEIEQKISSNNPIDIILYNARSYKEKWNMRDVLRYLIQDLNLGNYYPLEGRFFGTLVHGLYELNFTHEEARNIAEILFERNYSSLKLPITKDKFLAKLDAEFPRNGGNQQIVVYENFMFGNLFRDAINFFKSTANSILQKQAAKKLKDDKNNLVIELQNWKSYKTEPTKIFELAVQGVQLWNMQPNVEKINNMNDYKKALLEPYTEVKLIPIQVLEMALREVELTEEHFWKNVHTGLVFGHEKKPNQTQTVSTTNSVESSDTKQAEAGASREESAQRLNELQTKVIEWNLANPKKTINSTSLKYLSSVDSQLSPADFRKLCKEAGTDDLKFFVQARQIEYLVMFEHWQRQYRNMGISFTNIIDLKSQYSFIFPSNLTEIITQAGKTPFQFFEAENKELDNCRLELAELGKKEGKPIRNVIDLYKVQDLSSKVSNHFPQDEFALNKMLHRWNKVTGDFFAEITPITDSYRNIYKETVGSSEKVKVDGASFVNIMLFSDKNTKKLAASRRELNEEISLFNIVHAGKEFNVENIKSMGDLKREWERFSEYKLKIDTEIEQLKTEPTSLNSLLSNANYLKKYPELLIKLYIDAYQLDRSLPVTRSLLRQYPTFLEIERMPAYSVEMMDHLGVIIDDPANIEELKIAIHRLKIDLKYKKFTVGEWAEMSAEEIQSAHFVTLQNAMILLKKEGKTVADIGIEIKTYAQLEKFMTYLRKSYDVSSIADLRNLPLELGVSDINWAHSICVKSKHSLKNLLLDESEQAAMKPVSEYISEHEMTNEEKIISIINKYNLRNPQHKILDAEHFLKYNLLLQKDQGYQITYKMVEEARAEYAKTHMEDFYDKIKIKYLSTTNDTHYLSEQRSWLVEITKKIQEHDNQKTNDKNDGEVKIVRTSIIPITDEMIKDKFNEIVNGIGNLLNKWTGYVTGDPSQSATIAMPAIPQGNDNEPKSDTREQDRMTAELKLQTLVDQLTKLKNNPEQLRAAITTLEPQIEALSKEVAKTAARSTMIQRFANAAMEMQQQRVVQEMPVHFAKFFTSLTISHLAHAALDEGISSQDFIEILHGLPMEFKRFASFSAGASGTSMLYDLMALQLSRQFESAAINQLKGLKNIAKLPMARQANGLSMYTKGQLGMFAGTVINLMLYEDGMTPKQIWESAYQSQIGFMIAGAEVRLGLRGIMMAKNLLKARELKYASAMYDAVKLEAGPVGILVTAAELFLADPAINWVNKVSANTKARAASYSAMFRLESYIKGQANPDLKGDNTCASKAPSQKGGCYAEKATQALHTDLQQMVYWSLNQLNTKYDDKQKKLDEKYGLSFIERDGGYGEPSIPVKMRSDNLSGYKDDVFGLWYSYGVEAENAVDNVREDLSPSQQMAIQAYSHIDMNCAKDDATVECGEEIQTNQKDKYQILLAVLDDVNDEKMNEKWNSWYADRTTTHEDDESAPTVLSPMLSMISDKIPKIITETEDDDEWMERVFYMYKRIASLKPTNADQANVQMDSLQAMIQMIQAESLYQKPEMTLDFVKNRQDIAAVRTMEGNHMQTDAGYWKYGSFRSEQGKDAWKTVFGETFSLPKDFAVTSKNQDQLQKMKTKYINGLLMQDTISVVLPKGKKLQEMPRPGISLLLDIAYYVNQWQDKSEGKQRPVNAFVKADRTFETNDAYQACKSDLISKNQAKFDVIMNPALANFVSGDDGKADRIPAAVMQYYEQDETLDPYAHFGQGNMLVYGYTQPISKHQLKLLGQLVSQCAPKSIQ